MTADVIIVLAVIAGVTWLAVMLVSALRNRGGVEEVPPNLKPGIDDQELETRRLERGQKAAVAFAGFLAVSLPLYFLTENSRQDAFVDEFWEASVDRGEAIAEEFACFDCHGPLGVGGVASFVEPRSGVAVSWDAPPLDDILYRYNENEVNFWITFGRSNTPMPPWGLAGGGPLNEMQVIDLVNYLSTIQLPQQEVVDRTPGAINAQLSRLANADAAVAEAIIRQSQVVAEIDHAPGNRIVMDALAERAREVLDGAGVGLDTDGDGLSDTAEAELSAISAEAVAHYRVVEPVVPSEDEVFADLVEEGLAALEAHVDDHPIFQIYIDSINRALDADEITDENPDTSGDGISDAAETQISGLFAEASSSTIPDELTVINLDPTNPETVDGVPDRRTATTMVAGLETVSINLGVLVDNEERIRPQEEAGLDFLLTAQEEGLWDVDIPGIAAAMDATEEEAERAVGLFNATCARCHTSGFPAGVPFTREVGSGGFGPALWEGRPVVQFGQPPDDPEETDSLIDFLINGSVAEAPYGLNGMGTGRMPGFGRVLSQDDIDLLARYLRSGNMTGKDE